MSSFFDEQSFLMKFSKTKTSPCAIRRIGEAKLGAFSGETYGEKIWSQGIFRSGWTGNSVGME